MLFVDRMNKRFVKATRAEMTPFLPKGGVILRNYRNALWMLQNQVVKMCFTGKEISFGLLQWLEAKNQLYDFHR